MSRQWWFLLLPVVGCGEPAHPPEPLTPGYVARWAGVEVHPTTVAAVRAATGVEPRPALERALRDVALATAAKERLPGPTLRAVERAALARALAEDATLEARSAPVTAQEVAEAEDALGLQLGRGRAVGTVHFVAEAAPGSPEEPAARELAQRVRAAVVDVPAADFERAARAAAGSRRGRTERVGPVTERGFVEGGGRLVPEYARAALALSAERPLSELVQTQFGFHVIRYTEELPAVALDPSVRRHRIARWVIGERAARKAQAAAEHSRGAAAVEFARDWAELTGKVQLDR